jgi:superfamily I DNA and/or RNA helicase
MVGDPKQLPQTVVVPNAEETLYNRSMYERLKDCGIREIMLDI